MCNRTGRWPVHEPVRTLANSLIFRVSRKRKRNARESLTARVPAEPGQGVEIIASVANTIILFSRLTQGKN